MKDTLQTRKGIEMYISKRIEVSWTHEEEQKIQDFRSFLQNTAKEIEHLLPSLYEELYTIDASLYNVLCTSFDEDIDIDTEKDK